MLPPLGMLALAGVAVSHPPTSPSHVIVTCNTPPLSHAYSWYLYPFASAMPNPGLPWVGGVRFAIIDPWHGGKACCYFRTITYRQRTCKQEKLVFTQTYLQGDRFVAAVVDGQSLRGSILEGALEEHHRIQGGRAEADCCHLRQYSLQQPVWRPLRFQCTLDKSSYGRAVYESLHLRVFPFMGPLHGHVPPFFMHSRSPSCVHAMSRVLGTNWKRAKTFLSLLQKCKQGAQ